MSPLQAIRDRLARAKNLHGSYQRVFTSPDGHVVLQHLMRQFDVHKSTFVRGDPHETAFNEGRRSVVLAILRYVNRDPQKLLEEIERGIEDE